MGWHCLLDDARMQTDIMFDENIVFEPPKPIKKCEYFCDKRFHVESIVSLFAPVENCGLIFINGEHCDLFTVDVSNSDRTRSGNAQTRLKQHKKGGQSSARFGRLHDAKVKGYLKEIAEEAREVFAEIHTVVIAGISTRPAELRQYLHTDLAKKIIGTIVMSASDDFNNTIIPKLDSLLQNYRAEKETKQLAEFVTEISSGSSEQAVYGHIETQQALSLSGLSKLYCHYDSVTENLKTEAAELGTDLIEIGWSIKGQELISMYGERFGLKWY